MRRGRGYLARGGPLASRRIIEEFVKIAALEQLRLSRGFRRRPLMRLFGRLGRWIRHDHLTGAGWAAHHRAGFPPRYAHQLITISTTESNWHDNSRGRAQTIRSNSSYC